MGKKEKILTCKFPRKNNDQELQEGLKDSKILGLLKNFAVKVNSQKSARLIRWGVKGKAFDRKRWLIERKKPVAWCFRVSDRKTVSKKTIELRKMKRCRNSKEV